MEKLQEIMGSVRFWFVTIIAVLEIAKILGLDPQIGQIIQLWLGTVTGIGTLDSFAKKLGQPKQEELG